MSKTLVVGLGISGQAVAQVLLKEGGIVYGFDDKPRDLLEGLTIVGQLPPDLDQLILSPGIPDHHPLLQEAKRRGVKILGEAELSAQRLQDREWMGITGTNGKTTVTLFMEHLLTVAGRPAKALGNVGDPLISYEGQGEVIVAELSSYQLETFETKALNACALLNITPDHLDRYESMSAYAEAKVQILNCLKPSGRAVVNGKTVKEWPELFKGHELMTFGFEKENDLFYDGENLFIFGRKVRALPDFYKGVKTHDVENWMAALGLAGAFGVDEGLFLEALESFKKPRHRIEKVISHRGVTFFDDSKGTNIDATVRAVESMRGPVVLIAGGVHKGASYKPWQEPFKPFVKALCLIGQAAGQIEEELKESFLVVRSDSLEEAVNHAIALASPGDNVLLSPGCSSFDMFKDYTHRGEEFQRCVMNWVRTNQ